MNMNMKKNSIKDWAKYFASICAVSGMLLVTSCGENRRAADEDSAEFGYGVDADASGGAVRATEMDPASNTYAAERDYDVNTLGTAAANRRQMEATGKNLSDEDFQRLRQEYENVNNQMRQSYRQSPGMSMRYTDDYRTPDYSYEYYGVYYDNVNDEQTRNKLAQMEQQRQDLKNQMRGKVDKKTGAYLAAEMDAVPKEGYDQLYESLRKEMQGQTANMQGTVFVEFVVDKNGQVTNPKVVDVIQGQASAGNMARTGSTGMSTDTGTGTSGEGSTDNATNTGMSPNSTGTVGSGNTAGTAGTTTGTTGNSTASGNDGAQAGQSGQAANSQTTQEQVQIGAQGTNTANTKQLEQQALQAIKSTSGKWEPAQMNGQPVASLVQMPIPLGMNRSQGNQNTNDRGTNINRAPNNNTGIEGETNVNPGSGTQNGGRTSTGTVNTGDGTGSRTTNTDGGK